MNDKDTSQMIKRLIKKERNYKRVLRLFNRVFKSILKYETVNPDHLPFREKGMILVCNHRDYWDIPLVFSIFPENPIHVLAKEELKKEIVGRILLFMGAVLVDRNDAHSRRFARKALVDLVLSGANVLICPEGTRNKTSATLLPFVGHGAVSIAQKTGRPIIPIAISKCGLKGKRRLARVCEAIFVDAEEDLDVANGRLFQRLYDALVCNGEYIQSNQNC